MKTAYLKGITGLSLALFIHGAAADVQKSVSDTLYENDRSGIAQSGTVIGEGKHCVIEAVAISNTTGEVLPKKNDYINCFNNFSEAIYFATQGQVQISFDATPDSIDKELENGGYQTLTNVIGIEYEHSGFRGASKSFTGGGTCATTSYRVNNLKNHGFNDKISSARAYAGCKHSYHYEHTNLRGASKDCGTSCSNIGKALNDRTSSIRWTK